MSVKIRKNQFQYAEPDVLQVLILQVFNIRKFARGHLDALKITQKLYLL